MFYISSHSNCFVCFSIYDVCVSHTWKAYFCLHLDTIEYDISHFSKQTLLLDVCLKNDYTD